MLLCLLHDQISLKFLLIASQKSAQLLLAILSQEPNSKTLKVSKFQFLTIKLNNKRSFPRLLKPMQLGLQQKVLLSLDMKSLLALSKENSIV